MTAANPSNTITIRPADASDGVAIARLADLDSAEEMPLSPLLLAEIDGELRAALSLRDDEAIADPFYPTTEIVGLLRSAAAATSDAPSRRRPGLHRIGRHHGAVSRRTLARR